MQIAKIIFSSSIMLVTTIQQNSSIPLLALTSLAILATAFSWKRQVELQQECDRLRILSKSKTRKCKQVSSSISSSSTNDVEDVTPTAPQDHVSRSTLEDQSSLMTNGLQVRPIGMIHSIYRLCVGTPRQGLLAPNARGTIELFKLGDASVASSVEGLEGYSHIWILFVFHLNTTSKNSSNIQKQQVVKSKISPPALGGQKVGIFATRTPHRYNPVGLTLCKLDKIQVEKQKVYLHISGLDLVDGTPVLDIKPYVPVYDSVQGDNNNNNVNITLPSWVEGGLNLRRKVVISDTAREQLKSILDSNPQALRFYGPHRGESTTEETLESAMKAIQQVLAIDVRSSYQTKKSRLGKFQAERSSRIKGPNAVESSNTSPSSTLEKTDTSSCTQQLDNLLVHYSVEKGTSSNGPNSCSENSGAQDILSVTSIRALHPEKVQ